MRRLDAKEMDVTFESELKTGDVKERGSLQSSREAPPSAGSLTLPAFDSDKSGKKNDDRWPKQAQKA